VDHEAHLSLSPPNPQNVINGLLIQGFSLCQEEMERHMDIQSPSLLPFPYCRLSPSAIRIARSARKSWSRFDSTDCEAIVLSISYTYSTWNPVTSQNVICWLVHEWKQEE
jgi:hypothetical protein